MILSQVKSKFTDSCENRNEQNENFIAFAASRNSNFDLVNDIKSIDEFECEFDSLHDAYEVLIEESLITKERNTQWISKALTQAKHRINIHDSYASTLNLSFRVL